jgi:KaiC/GvpD/RAD55 family RecA-like ATPase
LDDFVAKRKADNFTIFGTLNPLVVSEQERQTIMDLFDGIIEIYEKEQTGRPKRYVIVRKMYARKYKDTAIELERDSLF